ncbi:hypothetical protein MIND_00394000 [Mycena indigotica]|uniref:C2H2-type domain-containing protein n=1 Tax=Mycena indigotica TaxID=2126181 RepID=A0A8H6T3G8_9AGAR|nr:uncharacterized protein MIND_00394000 [Mycena indigotica]KAF7310204.1 hypothetical protein MIND_00394000 [Mycena indigotica]
MAPHRCPYCKRLLKSFSGVAHHVALSAECRKAEAAKIRGRRQRVAEPVMAVDETEDGLTPPMPPNLDNPADMADHFPLPLRSPTPIPAQPIPRPQHASVEEVMDQDDPENLKLVSRASPLRQEQTAFERLRDKLKHRGESKYSPFVDDEEWELAEWLTRRVNQTATDEFMNLKSTQKQKFSFHNNRSFLQKVDSLPTGPDWTCHVVTITGDRVDENGEKMKEEAELWIRNPVDCIREIIGNPALKNHTAYAPERVYSTNPASEDDRVIDESWTADEWYNLQVSFAGLRRFKKGISGVSQWMGKEYKEMERVLVGVMTGAVEAPVLTVVKSLVDFIYYASLQSHTKRTLDALQHALDIFHSHKQVIIDHGIRDHFNIPKIHSMQHYVEAIRRLGSCDGFNTESPERLHIDFAKNAYNASNGKDYTEQMTVWLQRREAIALRSRFILWYDSHELPPQAASSKAPLPTADSIDEDARLTSNEPEMVGQITSGSRPTTTYAIAKSPPAPHRTVARLEAEYGISDFVAVLTAFLRQNFLSLPLLPSSFDFYDIFHQIKISLPRNRYLSPKQRALRIRAVPAAPNVGRKEGAPASFDTALVIANPARISSILGSRRASAGANTSHISSSPTSRHILPPARIHRMVHASQWARPCLGHVHDSSIDTEPPPEHRSYLR